MKIHLHKKICTRMFISAWIIIVKKLKTTQISINKLTTKCSTLIQYKTIHQHNELLIHVTTLMKTNILSRRNYKKTHTVWSHLYQLLKQAKLTYNGRNEKVVARGQREGNCLLLNKKELSGMIEILYLALSGGFIGIWNCQNSSK